MGWLRFPLSVTKFLSLAAFLGFAFKQAKLQAGTEVEILGFTYNSITRTVHAPARKLVDAMKLIAELSDSKTV